MRIPFAALCLLTAFCLAPVFYVGAAGKDGNIVRKVGRLQAVLDDEGNVTSATLLCEANDELGDEASYVLMLNERTRQQASELKDQRVLVIGVLKTNDGGNASRIRVSSITPVVEKGEKRAEPRKPGKHAETKKPEKPVEPKPEAQDDEF